MGGYAIIDLQGIKVVTSGTTTSTTFTIPELYNQIQTAVNHNKPIVLTNVSVNDGELATGYCNFVWQEITSGNGLYASTVAFGSSIGAGVLTMTVTNAESDNVVFYMYNIPTKTTKEE